MSIEERIAEIIAEHDRCDEWGGPAWDCGADDCNASGNDQDEYAAHVARVLTTELGMTPEWAVEYNGAVHQWPHAGSLNAEMKRRAEKLFADQTVHKRRLVTRYVTPWENA